MTSQKANISTKRIKFIILYFVLYTDFWEQSAGWWYSALYFVESFRRRFRHDITLLVDWAYDTKLLSYRYRSFNKHACGWDKSSENFAAFKKNKNQFLPIGSWCFIGSVHCNAITKRQFLIIIRTSGSFPLVCGPTSVTLLIPTPSNFCDLCLNAVTDPTSFQVLRDKADKPVLSN